MMRSRIGDDATVSRRRRGIPADDASISDALPCLSINKVESHVFGLRRWI
jgi:hypothetical protein